MEIGVFILMGIMAIGFFVLYLKLQKGGNDDETLRLLNENFNARMRDMITQFQEQTKQVNLRLKENSEALQKSNRHMGDRLDNAAKVVSGVTEKLGKLQEATKQMTDIGRDISSLQDILRAPKLRGALGEFFLSDLLAQYFPKDRFSMPYTFRSGEKVDAVIHLADSRMVPIDAKFPLENFKKFIDEKDEKGKRAHHKAFVADVKKRIDEIARYILPDEGTLDFALLYIPAENVYYEVIIRDEDGQNLSSYAFEKRVIPVSPNNFFVYLQTVLMGLRGMQIEKSAKAIQEALVRLKGDFEKFGDDFDVLGSHLTNAGNKFDESKRRLEKLGSKLSNIELLGARDKSKLLK